MNSDGTTIDNATVQIRRKNESAWLTLGSPSSLNPWTAKIAGTFEMRGIGTVDGKSIETPVAEVEVMFPDYSQNNRRSHSGKRKESAPRKLFPFPHLPLSPETSRARLRGAPLRTTQPRQGLNK